MKTIQVKDEDYKLLMELSKELQTQANHSQAFPYFWEPASEELVVDVNDEGEVDYVFDHSRNESYTLEEYADCVPGSWKLFLSSIDSDDKTYCQELESDWHDYLEFQDDDVTTYSSNWEQSSDHNPSLFLSDVKGYIEANKHHLGRNPRTYARTVQCMPKMEKLIAAIYRLNPQPSEKINDEARRFVIEDNAHGQEG